MDAAEQGSGNTVLSRAVHAQVVTAPTPWQGGIVAISSFGFGGSNVHAIIAGCVRPKGPPPRALPAPEPAQASKDIENGGTVIEEVQEGEPEPEPLLFPPEASQQQPPPGSILSISNTEIAEQNNP